MTVKPRTSSSSSRGFTLVEMLMALLVMTVGLLGLLQSVNVAYHQNLRDKLRKEATLLAEERMHDWCRLPFDRITTGVHKEEAGEKMVAGTPWHFSVVREGSAVGNSTRKLRVMVNWSVKGVGNRHEIFALRSRRNGE
ncbi:type IV pilus modification PilV family protein [Geomonas anaerohicana]|uniref:Prepilin-type N-terminal cleavage/methylation domain-containing protein n=1 Tax=Geomonas anaerohicana TaxID=2798583 RepID=A0ABS0YBG0_9BACT|nr:prepilin-type N-terminal cleavage/methylation domain-containing protein [Geomonas anaerohicana]MBJ6749615.1 prepilin-type N-terminal cleavage/methylation domain-containing protein [Geomonas anaerohicana]